MMDMEREKEAFERHKFKDQYDELKAYYDEHEREHGYRYPSYSYDDEWETWLAAKAQAVPEGFVVVPKELSDEKANKMAKDEFSKISSLFHMEHRSEPDNSVEQLKRIWIANKIRNLKLFHKLFIGAQEQIQ